MNSRGAERGREPPAVPIKQFTQPICNPRPMGMSPGLTDTHLLARFVPAKFMKVFHIRAVRVMEVFMDVPQGLGKRLM